MKRIVHLAFFLFGPAAVSLAQADRPNVLFIAADDLRVEVGCYGDTVARTPNIDRLAGRGVLFERAYCQQALCNPSRQSLLSGLRPDAIGITDLETHLRDTHPDLVTLPQLFKQNGYHAQNIGKIFHNWHQHKYKGDPKSWSVPAKLHYNTHGSDTADVEGEAPENLSDVPRTFRRDVPDDAYWDGQIAEESIRALRAIKDKPFFLAVGFWKPHLPFNAPKKYWDLYDPQDIGLPDNPDAPEGVPKIALHDGRELMRSFKGELTRHQTMVLRHGYYAATSYLDAQLGKILDELDRLGLSDNTIIVFWSDHGFHLGEHDLWCKTSNFELDARVPLLIAAPGFQKKAGMRTASLVELLDLYPTLTDLCGLEAPHELEGKSLRPLLSDPKASVKEAALTQHPRPAYGKGRSNPTHMGYSARTDRYRYTEWRAYPSGRVTARELYDHRNDPRETVNLAGKPEAAALIRKLAEYLPQRPLQPGHAGVSAEKPRANGPMDS